ncbi:MAG: hypothetical protein ITF99_00835 [Chryseobacterium sp.]|nr:hypothetical protein [Chryseobacterium sp.]
MAKKLSIFLLILALGLFITPKQMLFAQAESICCIADSDSKDCCQSPQETQEKPCHDSGSKEHSCEGCLTCTACHLHIAFFSVPISGFSTDILRVLPVEKKAFTYITPEILDVNSKIWHPPKIV